MANEQKNLNTVKKINAEQERHNILLKKSQLEVKSLQKGSAAYAKKIQDINKILENQTKLTNKLNDLNYKQSDIKNAILLDMQKMYGAGSQNLKITKDLVKMGSIQYDNEEKAKKSTGTRQKFFQGVADEVGNVNALTQESLKNAEDLGTEDFKSMDFTNAKKELLEQQNAISARMWGKNKEAGDAMIADLEIGKKKLDELEAQHDMQARQNDLIKEGNAIMGDGIDNMVNKVKSIPGGGLILNMMGLGPKAIDKMKKNLGNAMTDFVKGGATDFKGLAKGMTAAIGPSGAVLIGLAAAVAIFAGFFVMLKAFSGEMDAVGEKFGAIGVKQFSADLMSADVEMKKLGFAAGSSAEAAKELADNFGVSFAEGIKLAPAIGNMSKVLGMSVGEGAKLVGVLTTATGLSAEGAMSLAEQTNALASAHGVAPGAVMKDIAESSEIMAKFTDKGGKNMMAAAVQARKLGVSLSTSAKVAEGLLDFESSIANEMEASIMIGKQLNFQKARELALNNDIEGAMENVISQLGSEEEFNKLNALQRDALSKSIGVSNDELAKFVKNQDKSGKLAGELEKKSFEDMVGEDAMSSMTEFLGSLKAIGAELMIAFGPTLNAITGILSGVTTKLQESKGAMLALKIVVGALGLKLLFMGLSAIWSGVFAALSWIPFVGPGLAAAGSYAAVAMMMASVYQALKPAPAGDMLSPASGKTQISTKEGGLFDMSPNDDVLAAPGLAKAVGGTGGGGANIDISPLISELRAMREEAAMGITRKIEADKTNAKSGFKEAGRGVTSAALGSGI